MTRRVVVSICWLGVVVVAGLFLRPLVRTGGSDISPGSGSGVEQTVESGRLGDLAESVASASTIEESRGSAFVVRRSDNLSVTAAGQCPRGLVRAMVTPNVPFRTLATFVVDVPDGERILQREEFIVDAMNGETIEGHFNAGDRCTLRLVGPHLPADPVPPRNPGNV